MELYHIKIFVFGLTKLIQTKFTPITKINILRLDNFGVLI